MNPNALQPIYEESENEELDDAEDVDETSDDEVPLEVRWDTDEEGHWDTPEEEEEESETSDQEENESSDDESEDWSDAGDFDGQYTVELIKGGNYLDPTKFCYEDVYRLSFNGGVANKRRLLEVAYYRLFQLVKNLAAECGMPLNDVWVKISWRMEPDDRTVNLLYHQVNKICIKSVLRKLKRAEQSSDDINKTFQLTILTLRA